MAGRKTLPGKMDSLDLFALRKEWERFVKRAGGNVVESQSLSTEDVMDFVDAVGPYMEEILDILDDHFNSPDGMADK